MIVFTVVYSSSINYKKKIFTVGCINFLSHCQNYITPNELLQQKENEMELTVLEMYRMIILHSFPFSKPKIYHTKCILVVK